MKAPYKIELEMTVDWLLERLLRHEDMQTLTETTIPGAVIGVLLERSKKMVEQKAKQEHAIARRRQAH